MSGINRRNFLKFGLAGAAALALENKLLDFTRAGELIEGGASVSRTTNASRIPIPSTCFGCEARCGILGFIEDGKLVKIEGNPRDLNNRGRTCARGQAGVNILYSPDRLLYPIKRVGLRGQGKWKRLAWDEAYTEVAAKLKPLRDEHRPDDLVFYAGPDGVDGLASRFLRAFGTSSVVQEAASYTANRLVARELTWGTSEEIADAAHSKFILNFGANPYEAHPHYVPFIQRLIDGRLNGARMTTFDCRLSNTAAKSDQWFSIRPGTDGLVALAMASVIMQRGLYDRDFIENWINYPPDKLTQHLMQYTPEVAAKESGVRANDIIRVAVEFAMTKPAVAISGGGVTSHSNGVQNLRAVSLLNAITGNVDVRGGACLPRYFQLDEPQPAPQPVPSSPLARPGDFPLAAYSVPQRVLPMIREKKQHVGALMTVGANPAFSNPDPETTAAVLKDEKLIPHFFAIDSFVTETAALADIVLPASTYLESWGVLSEPTYQLIPGVAIKQPLVPAQGESVPVHDILIELARRLGNGMEGYFAFGNMESYVSAAVAKIEGLDKAGGLKYLKANGLWIDATVPIYYRSYEKRGFATPSGKYEVHSKTPEGTGLAALPTYEPIAASRNLGDNDFILTTFQSSVHNNSNTSASMWLSEIDHENHLWMNSEVAKARGIKNGDPVRITSQVGTVVAKAHLSQGIHPNVVTIARHGGHWEYGKVARGERFDSSEPNSKLVWWDKHGSGAHAQRVIPVASDPIGGGQAWMDTKVTVNRA